MPSYRYLRDIKPEETSPEKDKPLTKKQKWANWWHYSWKWVLIGLVLMGVATATLLNFLNTVQPDMYIGIISPYSLPDQLTTKLGNELSAIAPDLNGDGESLVEVRVYVIQVGETDEDFTADPNMQMAGVTQLIGDINMGESMLFFTYAENTPGYQEYYSIFGLPDGTMAPEGDASYEEITRAFQDVPGLAGLDLTVEDTNGGQPFDGQLLFGDFRVGLRPIKGTALDGDEKAEEHWEQIHAFYQQLLGGAGA